MQRQLQSLLGDKVVWLCHGDALAHPALAPSGVFSNSPFIQLVRELRHFPGVVGWPWWDTGCPPNLLRHCPPQLGRVEKTQQKAHGVR